MNKNLKKIGFALAIVGISVGASASTVLAMRESNTSILSTTSNEEIHDRLHDAGFQMASYSPDASMQNRQSAPDLTYAAEKSVKAVVHIKNEQTVMQSSGGIDPFEFFFGRGASPRMQEPRTAVGYGSGVIISSDGYIMTNNHVIDNSDKLSVTLNDNRAFSAKLIGTDPYTDIALLKIDAKDLPTIPFGDSDKLRLGEWVLAVGNPFNLTGTVTAGIISATSRQRGGGRERGVMGVDNFIQTDAAVNSGNSGGALVNANGELIGINTMIYSQTGNYSGYSFAVPINTAAKVVADIKQYGSVQKAVLGIAATNVDADLVKKEGLKVDNGVFVADFADISAALAAGIEKGDVIIAINSNKVKDFGQLTDNMSQFRPGDKIKVTVNRKGKEKTFVVTLKNMQGGSGIIKKSEETKNEIGASIKNIDIDKMREFGISYGVEVSNIGDGPIKKASINNGFIILTIDGNPIKNVKTFESVIKAMKEKANYSGQSVSARVRGFYPNTGEVMTTLLVINPNK